MEFFDIFLAASVLAAVAMIGFTVWTVMRKRGNTSAAVPADAAKQNWRVYAVDKDDNCFNGCDIVLDREEDEFLLGRGDDCNLKLMRPQIGRRHAAVTRKGTVYTYRDLGSNAGSVCNGEKIQSKRLEPMTVIRVYDVALVFADCDVPQEFLIRAVHQSRG